MGEEGCVARSISQRGQAPDDVQDKPKSDDAVGGPAEECDGLSRKEHKESPEQSGDCPRSAYQRDGTQRVDGKLAE